MVKKVDKYKMILTYPNKDGSEKEWHEFIQDKYSNIEKLVEKHYEKGALAVELILIEEDVLLQ
ncbi:hypothetical protein EBU71_00100 [bacterium]|nr:hypothetical protein [Candidatus Elulimicrobium humile]